ncbi:putative Glutamyl-tRNA(Gln) amidotransferase subunit A [endosymbiont DhMRE of Dentiscutata heterogama]|uniref:amidase family protein n=1 Tax=endosymbiont DhMRE of Dentiscutata heterogama TaxID=1609546 RepID=UPI000629DA9D|nr:amidase family protein [endosymbiont DhMRE of Dentiscutata heterogama]CFW93462.1 putative Glutamyl-tRNA(Gln) amidotransferase subunit A [endosymbiont DhMRE of Dentiscutata heterogama]
MSIENKKPVEKYYTSIILGKNSKKKTSGYFVKDNFWTQKLVTTASSKFLDDFQPSQNAFVIELLKKKKKKLIGKVVLDEFACGGTGLHAATGPIFNPYNSSCIVGGSSSGSAWAVAKNLAPWSLGHDTGDSIRRPASYCGIVGFKPSYGSISRYGVIPMASSLDTVGILAREIHDIKSVFATISQPDPRDLLTVAKRKKNRTHAKNKIAVVAGIEKYLSSELNDLYHNTIKKLEKVGYTTEKITIPKKIREHLQTTYLILCSSELISHLNSLQGITYGPPENIAITQKRSKCLGEIVKQRLLIGSYFLEKQELFVKAQKMRYLVDKWVKKVLQNYDFLVFPSTNSTAPPAANFNHSFAGLISSHWSDNLLLLANFAGLPSLSLPIGFVNDLPVSININSGYGNDKKVLELAEELEK